MKQPVFCTAGNTAALHYARNTLQQWGYSISEITDRHVTHLLLPVPSFEPDGTLKGGGQLDDTLKMLPKDVTVLGGNLPVCSFPHEDFLKDEYYLCENADITAQCTVKLIEQRRMISDANVLIIGWGRIGQRLAPQMKERGARVTISARKPSDCEEVTALGYDAIKTGMWNLKQYDMLVNTVPIYLFDQKDTREDTLLVDLASVKGISGDRVIWAKGLPNQEAPDLSGILIAKTALRYALRKE